MNIPRIKCFFRGKALLPLFAAVAMSLQGCGKPSDATHSANPDPYTNLRSGLQKIAGKADGEVGIAIIDPDGDTITVNNNSRYQLMSVFKMHEALAVAHVLDSKGSPLDSAISFSRSELDPDTWSPMLKDHTEPQLRMPVSELFRYIIVHSDNNASNLLFDHFISPEDCDRFIRTDTGIEDFSIRYSERQMHADNSLADGNHSSPLACALLIDRIFSDSIVSTEKQTAIRNLLLDCQTGLDRIYAPLKDKQGVTLAHKTGSGFRRADGRLTAHNDVGRITLPDSTTYTLAVMVKDFRGTESEASSIIAEISSLVFNTFLNSTTHNTD